MKRLYRLGVVSNIKKGQASSEDEENKLWKLGLLGDSPPRVSVVNLLRVLSSEHTVIFLIGKNFSLRSGKENRNLTFNQLTLEPEIDKEPEKLVYVSFGEKNNQGVLNYRIIVRRFRLNFTSDKVKCLKKNASLPKLIREPLTVRNTSFLKKSEIVA